jgi:putative ABC transport system permease protein
VETDYYSKLSATNKQFLGAIIFVTIIMAIGGVFGVMNTMFAAISQRKKDIGVLRILGYARWQVLVSFFLESLVIALVGGILGCALGYLANGWTATSLVSGGQGGFGKTIVLRLVVDANTLAAGLVVTLFMGALGGLVPSLTAMRLRPLESLK